MLALAAVQLAPAFVVTPMARPSIRSQPIVCVGDNPCEPVLSSAEGSFDDACGLWTSVLGDLPEETTSAELRAVFDRIDTDKSGTLEPSELQEALSAVGVERSLEDIKGMWVLADVDQSGGIDYQEFVQLADDAFGCAPDE